MTRRMLISNGYEAVRVEKVGGAASYIVPVAIALAYWDSYDELSLMDNAVAIVIEDESDDG